MEGLSPWAREAPGAAPSTAWEASPRGRGPAAGSAYENKSAGWHTVAKATPAAAGLNRFRPVEPKGSLAASMANTAASAGSQ